ncbi:hypothetical protein [Streptomyces tsukubensis]|uniref:hypothetical protein n=1 Tax=Streptomyces tsukubensis TaxID=83656 RepID=UPI0015C3ED26|nr:hypothetical protein [Streptomyces tsukubensis]
MTDAEWVVVRPLPLPLPLPPVPLPVPGWMRGRGAGGVLPPGDAGRCALSGGQRDQVADPASDLPPRDRVCAFFRRWRERALVRVFPDRLRGRVDETAGRDAEPTAVVIASRSVKEDAVVGEDSRGFDGGKLALF